MRLAPLTAQNIVTYTIVVGANNPGGRLIPGMTANLDIVTGDRRGVLAVPNEALRFTPSGAAAALVRKGTGTTPARAVASGASDSSVDSGDVVAGLQRALGLDDATVIRIRAALADQGTTPRPQAGRSGAPGGATQPAGTPSGTGRGGGAAVSANTGRPAGGQGARGGGPAPGGAGQPGGGNPGANVAAAGPPPAAAAPGPLNTDGAVTPVSAVSVADPADQARLRTDEVLRGILTADQFAKYQAIEADIETAPAMGTLWVREADGTLTSHQVELGLASLNMTEIAAADVPEGARIVLRVRDTRR